MKTAIVRLFVIALCLMALVHNTSAGDCPASSKVTSCSPKCLQDSECSTMGGSCCPNLCNYKSCVIPKAADKGNKNQGGGSNNSYCGNLKCNSFEKCEMDKSTRRFKCVRA